jgi:SAM-dependent methyltransferase
MEVAPLRVSRTRTPDEPMTQVYRRPDDYDLEHLGDDEDISFYCRLSQRLGATRILELGCGTGRITLPLAEAVLSGENSPDRFVVGLDSAPAMLSAARARIDETPPSVKGRTTLEQADMLTWKSDRPFDLILIPCASITHVLTLKDQLTAWRTAFDNLLPGGRFVVEVLMPNLAIFADSFSRPPRVLMETDLDVEDKEEKTRLLRHRTTQYLGDEQKAIIRFMYEKLRDGRSIERYVDDFQSHVYFPRELELLFLHSGFDVETVYGDYRFRPLRVLSPLIIRVGRKPAAFTPTPNSDDKR